jgi:predicted site-specific integrase-resolvase
MNEGIYQMYRLIKRFIEIAENCCEKDHNEDELFKDWKKAIVHFDASLKGYRERYEKEKEDEKSII